MAHDCSTTSYTIGDPVEVCDAEGTYHGVVIEVYDTELSVQMLKANENQVYIITDDAYIVPFTAIARHAPLHGNDDNAPHAFHTLGFRMLDGGTFVKHSDETDSTVFPIGDAAFDVYSDDDDDSAGSLREFIVDDEDCEPFRHALVDNAFVRETHAAVREFNSWVPQNDQEYCMRQFINSLEARAVRVDDDIRVENNGGSAPSYSNPT